MSCPATPMKRQRREVATPTGVPTPAEKRREWLNSLKIVGITPDKFLVCSHANLFEFWGECPSTQEQVCLTLGEGGKPDCLQVGKTHLVFPSGTKFE